MGLRLRHVTKRFGDFVAVDDVTIDIPEQEMFGFLGANGAGKTTTFRMILGLLDPTEGEITWNNQPITYESSHLIGYLPEERGLYPKLKVKEQLIYLGRLRGMDKETIVKEMRRWLERFKVPEYENKKVEELSKGNQQKIQFIAAVIHRPKLLILDEPFSGLDPVNVELLKKAVIDLKNEGTTIVFSSHRMEHVEELCEHLCIMHRGKPIVHGSLKEIKRSFGKKNIIIHADFSLEELRTFPGVVKAETTAEGIRLQIENEEVSQQILAHISQKGFIRKFSLEEPSLNDIFIEKVGAAYE
ncbi:ABC-2 type transport system ATP-binding protein [Thermolongibacillus altinsuensis]|uniref:ABC-2 type transport system ATP-binding protein n=1 Tax=Thermolongibacillus altinsuensis TaxID=575256 RepID=A0A4R1QI88_9BACL|nr:ABC transporter ATP-binding protein [Thermolongibacillus altinsuensis]TCL53298.1 ABC-2 type transport system ATP-binding protein [Thermolongibacillus altinsuensis]GMB07985.1 putative ABC transporter ATP-binding protein YhaQ [Thermolongibacillus altinsuensis]